MEYEIRFTYSWPQYTRIAKALWLQRNLSNICAFVGVPLLVFLAGLATKEIVASPLCAIILGVFLGVAGTYSHLFWSAYSRFDNNRRSINLWDGVELTYKFTEDGVHYDSTNVSGYGTWKLFDGLWRHSKVWILLQAQQPFMIVPEEMLSDELKTFLIRKLREAGVKTFS